MMWVATQFPKPDSELEKLFIVLFAFKFFNWSFVTYRGQPSPFCVGDTWVRGSLNIDQQVEIAGRRCDFLFTLTSKISGKSRRIAVECDGHGFHERTPEQAANDRSRDRALLREGVPTLRYTFSELTKNPNESFDDLRLTLIAFRQELDGESER
jgi:very-short-patch-repair endonuclease